MICRSSLSPCERRTLMPNLSDGPIQVFDNSVASINLALALILERLDGARGLRGEPTIYAATTVGAPGASTQAARLADLPSEDPTSVLLWILAAQSTTAGTSAPTALTDGTGGTANDTLTALGGITALTDSSGGTANDTVQALPDPADAPATADALRDDLVANLIPALRNNLADLTAKVNALIADMNDARDNDSDLGNKINAVITALQGAGLLL